MRELNKVQLIGHLGHQNLATTKVYAHHVGLKQDRCSPVIARRLGLQEALAEDV